jgi:Glycosyl hydrolase family 10
VNFLPGVNRPTRAQIEAALRRFEALGLEVEITELNVHVWGFEGDQTTRLETQRRFYRDVVAACLAVDACRATTLWLFTDRYPTTVEKALGQDAMPLVFDDDYRRKPAYSGVRAGPDRTVDVSARRSELGRRRPGAARRSSTKGASGPTRALQRRLPSSAAHEDQRFGREFSIGRGLHAAAIEGDLEARLPRLPGDHGFS